MAKLLFFLVCIFTLISCSKTLECKNDICTIRTINITSEPIIGAWDNNPIDTIDGGDAIYYFAKPNASATFHSAKISYTIKASECDINFPLF